MSSYILFVTDSEPNGSASRLFLDQNGAYVLAGSTVGLSYSAADRALHSVAAPDGVDARAQRGTVSGDAYTAPASAGTDRISLSAFGVSGSGTMHVIEMCIRDRDCLVHSLEIFVGQHFKKPHFLT